MFSGCMYVVEWLGYDFALGSFIRCCILIAAWHCWTAGDQGAPAITTESRAVAVMYRCVLNTTSAWISLFFEFFCAGVVFSYENDLDVMLSIRCVTSCLLCAEFGWIDAPCSGIRMKYKPCVSATEGSRLPELQRSGYVRQRWRYTHRLEWHLSALLLWQNGHGLNMDLVEFGATLYECYFKWVRSYIIGRLPFMDWLPIQIRLPMPDQKFVCSTHIQGKAAGTRQYSD